MINSIKKKFPDSLIYIPLINIPQKRLKDHEKQNLRALNNFLERNDKINTIPTLPEKEFKLENDNYHWRAETANNLLSHWLNHLNC